VARLTREELERYRGSTVPDLVGPGTRLLIVGINPGLLTAARQTHFCHPSNRFYPALRQAGIIDWELDSDTGITPAQRRNLIDKGIGITNLVSRATARASELSADELREGRARLAATVRDLAPTVVAVLGVTAYRTAFARPQAQLGEQSEDLEGAALWVAPNPSGLNAHVTADVMADWFARLSRAARL
jgi:double-stranded uracil-DNA glycosylase